MKVDISKPVLIQPVAFKDVFLQADGSHITRQITNGAGKVSCQMSIEQSAMFKIKPQKDGTVGIESVKFPGIYLRMDGSRVRSFSGSGAGLVNCQYGVADWERFRLSEQKDGTYQIESAAFPNVFLRMDGSNPSGKAEGFGVVNCQYGCGTYERFYLVNPPEVSGIKNIFGKFPG